MYIYAVTLQMSAPGKAGEKKSSPVYGQAAPDTDTASNVIMVSAYEFEPEDEFIVIGSGVSIWRCDFFKYKRGGGGARTYSETVVIDDIGLLEETIATLLKRARDAISVRSAFDFEKPILRLANDNTLPGLESFARMEEPVRAAPKDAEHKQLQREDKAVFGKFRSLFSKKD